MASRKTCWKIGQTSAHIRHWYQQFNGTSNGLPLQYVVVNMEPDLTWQGQTDVFLRATNVAVCGNDYVGNVRHRIRNLFAPPNATNSDPRPVFVAINCLSNSPSHRRYQVLINDYSNGGGAFNFATLLTNTYRRILDSVQAPPPVLTQTAVRSNQFEFTFPGQRGRTNRLEATPDFLEWSVVTNVFGTNAPIRVRDPLAGSERFYRVRRL